MQQDAVLRSELDPPGARLVNSAATVRAIAVDIVGTNRELHHPVESIAAIPTMLDCKRNPGPHPRVEDEGARSDGAIRGDTLPVAGGAAG